MLSHSGPRSRSKALFRGCKSLSLAIPVPELDIFAPIQDQDDDVLEGLGAASELKAWWVDHVDGLRAEIEAHLKS